MCDTAPLQLSVQEDDSPPEQDHCEKKTDLCEDDQEPLQIKEEQEEELWTTQTDEKQEDDTKDSMFNIIYVQRSDEDGRQFSHQNQEVEDKGDSLPGSSSEQLKSEPGKEVCGASEPTSDCQMSEVSDDEWRDSGGFHSGTNRRKPQHAGETADRPYTCSVCNKNFRIKSTKLCKTIFSVSCCYIVLYC